MQSCAVSPRTNGPKLLPEQLRSMKDLNSCLMRRYVATSQCASQKMIAYKHLPTTTNTKCLGPTYWPTIITDPFPHINHSYIYIDIMYIYIYNYIHIYVYIYIYTYKEKHGETVHVFMSRPDHSRPKDGRSLEVVRSVAWQVWQPGSWSSHHRHRHRFTGRFKKSYMEKMIQMSPNAWNAASNAATNATNEYKKNPR